GIEPSFDLSRDLGHHGGRRTGGIERLRLAVTLRSVAPALADAGADKARAQDAYADAEWLELQAKPLRHADDGKLARRVGTKPQSALHPRHRCGVDDMAAFAVGADVRQEAFDAVKHAHHIDVDHPSPIIQRDVVHTAAGMD